MRLLTQILMLVALSIALFPAFGKVVLKNGRPRRRAVLARAIPN